MIILLILSFVMLQIHSFCWCFVLLSCISIHSFFVVFFFKQKTAYEILALTGVQTCALPILHLGETNTGKTYTAMERLKEGRKAIYLSPLRILALENFEKLNSQGIKCNLLTGEEEIIIEGATHTACTIEKLNVAEEYDVAIIDEIQMIDDDQRGAAWTRALLGLKCKEIHVCGALNSKEILIKIIESCKDEYEYKEYIRDLPLKMEYEI